MAFQLLINKQSKPYVREWSAAVKLKISWVRLRYGRRWPGEVAIEWAGHLELK